MPKLPVLKPQEVIRALNRAGFVLYRITGSHHHFDHQETEKLLGREIFRTRVDEVICEYVGTVEFMEKVRKYAGAEIDARLFIVSSLPILEKGEQFPKVIYIHVLFCSHYKFHL